MGSGAARARWRNGPGWQCGKRNRAIASGSADEHHHSAANRQHDCAANWKHNDSADGFNIALSNARFEFHIAANAGQQHPALDGESQQLDRSRNHAERVAVRRHAGRGQLHGEHLRFALNWKHGKLWHSEYHAKWQPLSAHGWRRDGPK
jgi:hypothetical protein